MEYALNYGVISFIQEKLYDFAFTVSHEVGYSLGMLHGDDIYKCGNERCVIFS